MFGETLIKHCPNCKENVKYTTAILYMIEGVEYTATFICPKCKTDLAEEDREFIRKARIEGKNVVAVMC